MRCYIGCTHGRMRGRRYDHVFNPEAGQGLVFEEVAPLIRSVADGYSVCIFAYGQTGSGEV